ncbi:glutaminyl-peptide cyclotransferase-like isoform X1 [Sycon ciliatum]|uniref:glutaminyl-peptide cyclotransferase-like isoform X1 n=1 Tax=Sycon ciliatum TaxID=27933 RepID=UPI0031F5F288
MARHLVIALVLLCSVTGLSGGRHHSVKKRAVQSVVPVLGIKDLQTISVERSNMTQFMSSELDPFLIVRVAGTRGNTIVRTHIVNQLTGLTAGWHVELDSFTSSTPLGTKHFSNVVATLDPMARRRLVLACHFDSKLFTDGVFLGAIDSAVPCAMLINLVRVFDKELKSRARRLDTTLQLLFFDGEEAFVRWTDTDSLYGSRHLAAKMAAASHPYHPTINQLQAMDAFVLLDLIGSNNPNFYNYFPGDTGHLFMALQSIENRLQQNGLLRSHEQSYFTSSPSRGSIGDDHVPFMRKGVPILHVIDYKDRFPTVWHRISDNKQNLHTKTIDNLNRIFRVFVAEYLDLDLVRPSTLSTLAMLTTSEVTDESTSPAPATPPVDASVTSGTASNVELSTTVAFVSSLYAGVTTLGSLFGSRGAAGPDATPAPVNQQVKSESRTNPKTYATAVIAISIAVTVAMLYVRAGAN